MNNTSYPTIIRGSDEWFDNTIASFGRETFELKEEHIKLLRGAYIRWDNCEYGAPAIDSKRPFGNSGRYTIVREMAELLEIPTFKDMEGEDNVTEEQADYLESLWRETQLALQIILYTKSFKTGLYESPTYHTSDWRLYDSSPTSVNHEHISMESDPAEYEDRSVGWHGSHNSSIKSKEVKG